MVLREAWFSKQTGSVDLNRKFQNDRKFTLVSAESKHPIKAN